MWYKIVNCVTQNLFYLAKDSFFWDQSQEDMSSSIFLQKNRPLIGWPIHCMYWSSMWHSPSRSFYFCMHYLHDLQPEIQPPNFRKIYLYHAETFEAPDVPSTSENVVLSGLPMKGLFFGRKPLEFMSWLGSRKKRTLGKF